MRRLFAAQVEHHVRTCSLVDRHTDFRTESREFAPDVIPALQQSQPSEQLGVENGPTFKLVPFWRAGDLEIPMAAS
jgi:hypothetical protein